MDTYSERDLIFRKLRETVKECGQDKVTPAIILGPWEDMESPISGHQYIYCPTLGEAILGNVDWKTARTFEDV